MAYTTANNVTTNGEAIDAVLVTDYYGGAVSAPGVRQDGILRRAERRIAEVAPPPDPKTQVYTSRAADTELAVFEFLFESRPYLERENQLDASAVYAGDRALLDLIRAEMGEFYVGPREVVPRTEAKPGAKTMLHNVSPEPLW